MYRMSADGTEMEKIGIEVNKVLLDDTIKESDLTSDKKTEFKFHVDSNNSPEKKAEKSIFKSDGVMNFVDVSAHNDGGKDIDGNGMDKSLNEKEE